MCYQMEGRLVVILAQEICRYAKHVTLSWQEVDDMSNLYLSCILLHLFLNIRYFGSSIWAAKTSYI
jgi:hypothetical protein